MKTTLGIKNFRVFDEKGVEFQLEPITFLTGCNSSGKSTLVKAILFLQSFLKQIMEDHKAGKEIRLDEYKVNFSASPLNSLGGFSKVVNRKSDNTSITIEYSIYSKMLSRDVTVSMTFDSLESDLLNNAYLNSLKVSLDGNVFFSTSRENHSSCNVNIIKKLAKEFIIIEELINRYENICNIGNYDENESSIIENELKKLSIERGRDVLSSRRRMSISARKIIDIDWQISNDSLYHLDLIEKTEGMSKSETIDYLATIADYFRIGMYNGIRGSLYRIIWLFEDSSHSTLKSFWLEYEEKFLKQQIRTSKYDLEWWNSFSNLSTNVDLEIPQPFTFNRMDGDFDEYTDAFIDIADKFSVIDGELDVELDGVNQKDEHDEYSRIKDTIYNQPELFDFKYLYSVLTDADFWYTRDYEPRWEKSNEWGGLSYGADYYYLKNNKQTPDDGFYTHYMAEAINDFINRLILEVLTPDWMDNISYVSSSRVDVQRLYTLDNQDDFTKLIKSYFEARAQFGQQHNSDKDDLYLLEIDDSNEYVMHYTNEQKDTNKYVVGTFVKNWCKKLGIGNNLELSLLPDGIGAQVKVFDDDFPKGNLLSYEGYGLTQLMSILLQIETEILSNRKGTIIIEEPEIHLHPRLQSLLTDMFYEAYNEYGIHFIIETHSEYMIRKSQLLVKQMNYESQEELEKDCPFRTYYIPENGAEPYSLVYRTDGVFENDFGEGFFDEAENLAFQIL